MNSAHLMRAAGLLLVVLLFALPWYAAASGQPFLVTLTSRILIFALAACSLNLVLGFGGMVSFGHAMYMGLGAYAVGLLAHHDIASGWTQLGVTVLACASVGLLTGLVCLRTSGVAFIMITLAFAQLFYYLFVSLKQYGGDDGMSLSQPSDFGLFKLDSPTSVYITTLVLLLLVLAGTTRWARARFGMVVQGCRINERRMKALGFATLRYKLAAYVMACVIAGLAGMLLANLTGFASPAYLAWTISGELIVMVVLGGMGTVIGPVVGAAALLIGEEWLKELTEHWMLILGPIIVGVVLTTRRGLVGYWHDLRARMARSQGSRA